MKTTNVCLSRLILSVAAIAAVLASSFGARGESGSKLNRLKFNNPGLVVDLGVGLWAWPMPLDYDGDGDLDLVVSCPDVPYNGTYFFENPGGGKLPAFRRGVRIDRGLTNVQVSYIGATPRVLSPGIEYADFNNTHFAKKQVLSTPADFHAGKLRANQWKYADYDGDGVLDLLIGVEDWKGYGWDNAFNERGEWTHEPLHGYVYLARNEGTNDRPKYGTPEKLVAGGKTIDVYGMPSPNLADFDGDGDLDLLCGEFIDRFTYFENQGTRQKPVFVAGRFLVGENGLLRVPLCMPVTTAVDWDGDGDVDLVVGQEDGRVMLFEHTGRVVDGLPRFTEPKFFQQEADDLKFGALATPASFDWDGDGDEDLICGNTAGEIGFIENLDGGCPPKWAKPRLLEADGMVVRIQAGPNGSIQGPCEAKWGYTSPCVADWDQDGLPDIIVNTIWGRVLWYKNIGPRQQPRLSAAQAVEVDWTGAAPKPAWNWWKPQGKESATQWRTTPQVLDWNGDGLNDLVMIDHEGFLALFGRERDAAGKLRVKSPQRVFVDSAGRPLQLATRTAGGSGRRKFWFADWNGDGMRDLLIDGANAQFYRGGADKSPAYSLGDEGAVDTLKLAGHSTSPTVVDWNRDQIPDLLIGAEDGRFYYLENSRKKSTKQK